MLRTRVLSAIILLPLALGVLYLGGWWFFGAIGLVMTLAAWEFVALMRRGGRAPWLPATVALIWIPLLDVARPQWRLFAPGLSLVMAAGLAWAMCRFNSGDPEPTSNWALTVAGGLYLGWFGSHFLRLRELGDGLDWSVVAYGSTWLADSGAYFIGRAWGRRKLAAKLSPGKTWVGTLGGLVVGAGSAALLAAVFGLGTWHGLALGVLIGAVSPVGDLGVSMIKRQVGAKDSSMLIPGHGGVLDKIDSLLISVTLATYYVVWVVE